MCVAACLPDVGLYVGLCVPAWLSCSFCVLFFGFDIMIRLLLEVCVSFSDVCLFTYLYLAVCLGACVYLGIYVDYVRLLLVLSDCAWTLEVVHNLSHQVRVLVLSIHNHA